MQWRLFSLAAPVSFVLFVATALMWVRSGSRSEGLYYGFPFDRNLSRTQHHLISVGGRVHYVRSSTRERRAAVAHPAAESPRLLAGAGEASSPTSGAPALTFGQVHVLVPYWFLVVLLAIAPAWWLYVQLRARHRRRHVLCRCCGYDLRATPDRCPEVRDRAAGYAGSRRVACHAAGPPRCQVAR